MSKEEYLEKIKGLREVIKSGEYAKCSCPNVKCEWHGNCYECIIVHRHQQSHVPNCLKPLFMDKIKALAEVAELVTSPKEATPDEYRDYVRSVCPNEGKQKSDR